MFKEGQTVLVIGDWEENNTSGKLGEYLTAGAVTIILASLINLRCLIVMEGGMLINTLM